MFRIYSIGLSILIIAIIANAIVFKLGIKSWYTFISLLTENGSSAFSKLTIIDYLWLFLAYSIVLGLGYWIGDKVYVSLFN